MLLKRLPFKPGRSIPEVALLGRKRGLSTATIAGVAKRTRRSVLKGKRMFCIAHEKPNITKMLLIGLEGLQSMVDPYRGKEVPNTVESIKWENGLSTCLPWTIGAHGETWVSYFLVGTSLVNFSLQDKDLVYRMAKAPDARDPVSALSDWCLRLEPPQEHQPLHTHDQRVREALGNGQCIVIVGESLEGPESLSLTEMEAWRGPRLQRLECMGE